MEKLVFEGEGGEQINFYVMETTRLAGRDYILVTDVPSGDGECYILKDMAEEDEESACYEFVEDDKELDYLLSVFAELLEDVDLEG